VPFTVLMSTRKALGRLDVRLEKVTDGLVELERDMRIHKVELLEIYDKIHRLFGRIAKRAAIDNPPAPMPEVPEHADAIQIDEISRAILARRAKGKAA